MDSIIHDEFFTQWFQENPAAMAIILLSERVHLDVNNAWETLTGFTKEEALGKSTFDLGFWNAPTSNHINTLVQEKKHLRNELTFIDKRGRTITVMHSSIIIELSGVDCSFVTMIDITKERQNDVEISRLSRLNLIGEMAAAIGHEVRNHLTIVRGFLQIFNNKDEFIHYYPQINMMIKELDRANYIISEFLSVTKIESIELKEGNLNALIEDISPLLQADALLFGHELSLELSKITDVVMAEMEITQLLLNLVRNGFESMTSPGILKIQTRMEDSRVVLAVEDNGSGLPDDVLADLGKPFLTTKVNGTGLGLSVCFRIAEKHLTKLEYTTSKYGTKFFVRLATPT